MNESKGGRVDCSLQWKQWQLIDSILPTGGFAHSSGLEAAIQSGMVSSPEDVGGFVVQVLENTGSLLLPFVNSTMLSPSLETLCNHDKILDATLTNEVTRKASLMQGRALMRAAATIFTELPSLRAMRNSDGGRASFHHGPVFGLICGLLGLDAGVCQRAFMFIAMRDVLSAATRLNLVGPLGAAALQNEISVVAENLSMKYMDRTVDQAYQTSPLLDTVHACHAYLFSRMFCS